MIWSALLVSLRDENGTSTIRLKKLQRHVHTRISTDNDNNQHIPTLGASPAICGLILQMSCRYVGPV